MPTLIEYSGERLIVSAEALPGYPGAVVLAELDRMPGEYETVDEASGQIVEDAPRKADGTAGREHIKALRLVKMVEASVILSGHDLTAGMIAEEAALRGVTTQQLAQRVMDNTAAMRARELQRIAEKNGINQAEEPVT